MAYFLVFLIITVASFIFAMLGLGGGTVYVPVINWFGYDMKEVAIPLGLLLNGLNTLLALIPFARKKLIFGCIIDILHRWSHPQKVNLVTCNPAIVPEPPVF